VTWTASNGVLPGAVQNFTLTVDSYFAEPQMVSGGCQGTASGTSL
jgi:hypothetical protein